MLNLTLFGTFQAEMDREPVPKFGSNKAKALLIYLAVEACSTHQAHQREGLMTLFWPGLPLKSAQQNLRQTLYLLRQVFQVDGVLPDLILVERFTLAWNPAHPLFLDVNHFEQLAGSSEPTDWQRAVDLYQGPFLADFYLPDSEPFEAWAANKRALYQQMAQEVLVRLTGYYLDNQNWQAAEGVARRHLQLDGWVEHAHRQLIEVLARAGRRGEALAQYERLRQLLRDELGLEPEPETEALVARIRAGELRNIPSQATTIPVSAAPSVSAAKPAQPAQPQHNLPQPLTSFIGRQAEMDEVLTHLVNHRLVTLAGSGGVGKTNLSLATGRTIFDQYPDGVWLVELAPVSDPARVNQTVAYALGLWEPSMDSVLDRLLEYLREKNCLLILDNCEHVIQSAAQFALEVLKFCPDVKILATSRENLEIPGEVVYRVPPLSFPTTGQRLVIENWQTYDAARLFVERAAAVLPDFQVTPENFLAIMEICQRLDGIPLALELAAAQVKMLPAAQIAARLDDRFRLLKGGSRVALPHQQTLHASIEWSWELLSEAETKLMQRLSIFSGGMTLESAEAICAGDGVADYEILGLLTQLVNKSLVISRRDRGQDTYYYLLETIREYALDQLSAAGQTPYYRDRHLGYYRAWVEGVEKKLNGPRQAALLRQLEKDLDNIRGALAWAQETEPEAGLRLAAALWRFWRIYGYMPEGEQWLNQLLARPGPVAPGVMAKALWVQAHYGKSLYGLDRAKKLAEKSLALYREAGDELGLALGYLILGDIIGNMGDLLKSKSLVLESLAIFRKLGEKFWIAHLLAILHDGDNRQTIAYRKESEQLFRDLGDLAGLENVLEKLSQDLIWQGEFDEALQLLQESLAIRESLGLKDSYDILSILGTLYARTGAYQRACRVFEQALESCKQAGEKSVFSWSKVKLGYVYLWMGDIAQARKFLTDGQKIFKKDGIVIGVIFAIEGLACLAVEREQAPNAARLFGWADAARKKLGDTRPLAEQGDVDKYTAKIIAVIGEAAYAAAYAEGQTLTIEQAMDLAAGEGP